MQLSLVVPLLWSASYDRAGISSWSSYGLYAKFSNIIRHASCLHFLQMSLPRKTPWLPNAETCLPYISCFIRMLEFNSVLNAITIGSRIALVYFLWRRSSSLLKFWIVSYTSLFDMHLVCISNKPWCHFLDKLHNYAMQIGVLPIYHSFVVTKHFNTR